MKKLASSVGAITLAASLLLTGCGNSVGTETMSAEEAGIDLSVKASDVTNIKPLSFEEIEAESATSQTDIENTVYQYVSDSVLVDTSNLITVTEADSATEIAGINSLIDSVNNGLANGEVPDGCDETMMNYMLLKFSNTPFAWKVTNVDIKGMDAQTRLYFVDVTYKTDESNTKTLIPDSVIVHGDENEEALLKTRYTDYLIWLEDQINGTSKWEKKILSEKSDLEALQTLINQRKTTEVMDGYEEDANLTEKTDEEIVAEAYSTTTDADGNVVSSVPTWEDKWGNLEDILKTQSGITLMERAAENSIGTNTEIGVTTYAGLTEVAADHGAEMTFRFVIKNTYNIGLDSTMKIQSIYLYNYQIDNEQSLIDTYQTETQLNADVLSTYIETLIKSYRKAIDECNHIGLNNLFLTYAKYDTYVEDLTSYAYLSSGGFSFEVIGRKGNEFAVIVNQRTKERAKGTYMTMPTYLEKVLMKVKLCDDDTIKIVSFTTLQSTLIGEPLSVIRDVTGISEQIAYDAGNFTVSSQQAVEEVIANFSLAQLQYSGVADSSFWDVVDMGISATEKQKIYDLFEAVQDIGATRSTVWLSGYETKSNLYVTVKLREVFEGSAENYDTESTLGIFYRDGSWKVISYSRTLAVKTSKTTINTSNCLVIADVNATDKIVLNTQVSSDLSSTESGGNSTLITGTDDEGFDDVSYTTTAASEESLLPDAIDDGSTNATTEAATEAVTEVTEDDDDPLAGLF